MVGLAGSLGKRALDLLGSLSLPAGASSPSSASSEENALLTRAEGASTAKRHRRQLGLEPAPPSAAYQSRCNLLAGKQLFNNNPLFEAQLGDDEFNEYDFDTDEEEGELDGGLDGERFWQAGGHGDENTPLNKQQHYHQHQQQRKHQQQGGNDGPVVGSQDPFTEFTPSVGTSCPLTAFLAELRSTTILCALTSLQRRSLHPVGGGVYATLEVTVAAMLALCRRASIGADEMSPELLLTCLWLLMSAQGSQYRSGLHYNCSLFLQLHPDRASMDGPLRSSMVELQMQLLKRCSWRVLFLDKRELQGALRTLGSCPEFNNICDYVEASAHYGFMPVGTTAATYAASSAAKPGVAGFGAAAPGAPAAPRCSGNSGSSQGGLDGRYWQQPGARASGERGGRPPRAVLGNSNRR